MRYWERGGGGMRKRKGSTKKKKEKKARKREKKHGAHPNLKVRFSFGTSHKNNL